MPSPEPTARAGVRIWETNGKRVSARMVPVSPWKQLESSDLTVYAANLRAAGCPPKTMRDILLPEIEEKFAPPVSEPDHFWASFSERQAAAATQAEQAGTLRQQKDRMLEALLGFAWTSAGLRQAYGEEAAGSVGFLDYERAEKLLCLTDRFNEQLARTDLPHHSALSPAWRQAAEEVLSPAELEEAELRDILLLWQRRHPDFYQAGLSGSELRQLMAFRREQAPSFPSALLAGDHGFFSEPAGADEYQLHLKARTLLGDGRFMDYLKGCDAGFERTLAALDRAQLPRNLALPLFDLREQAMARAEAIRQLPAPRAEKRMQLAALRQNALEQLAPLSNATLDRPLLEINQDWLQEIAHP